MPDSSFNEQVNNKENEIIQENELKNSSSKEDYCSALFHEKTQKEIAHDLNISRSYVSRIEKRAITKMLRDFIKSGELK